MLQIRTILVALFLTNGIYAAFIYDWVIVEETKLEKLAYTSKGRTRHLRSIGKPIEVADHSLKCRPKTPLKSLKEGLDLNYLGFVIDFFNANKLLGDPLCKNHNLFLAKEQTLLISLTELETGYKTQNYLHLTAPVIRRAMDSGLGFLSSAIQVIQHIKSSFILKDSSKWDKEKSRKLEIKMRHLLEEGSIPIGQLAYIYIFMIPQDKTKAMKLFNQEASKQILYFIRHHLRILLSPETSSHEFEKSNSSLFILNKVLTFTFFELVVFYSQDMKGFVDWLKKRPDFIATFPFFALGKITAAEIKTELDLYLKSPESLLRICAEPL
jgi:hypothetical protein